jgi:hypothetical protein
MNTAAGFFEIGSEEFAVFLISSANVNLPVHLCQTHTRVVKNGECLNCIFCFLGK